jgi:hypothetical protein
MKEWETFNTTLKKENPMRFDKRAPVPSKAGNDGTPGACPACDGGWSTLQFNWRLALAEPRGDWGKYTRTLLVRKILRRGSLYECPQCKQAWYLDAAQEMMTVVSPKKIHSLEQWGSAPQLLPESLWLKAKKIGATPAHRLANDPHYAEIPCRIQVRQGKTIDRCLLIFSPQPPLAPDPEKLFEVGEVAELEPSDFTLPLPVRRACCLSSESKPGEAATLARTADKKYFRLNWSVNFFDENGIPGKDLVLAEQPVQGRASRTPLINEDLGRITTVRVDWSPRVGELLGS